LIASSIIKLSMENQAEGGQARQRRLDLPEAGKPLVDEGS